jgi:hypothetical protein
MIRWLAVIVGVAVIVLGAAYLAHVIDGGGTDCYPPINSGKPESAATHGLVNEECK